MPGSMPQNKPFSPSCFCPDTVVLVITKQLTLGRTPWPSGWHLVAVAVLPMKSALPGEVGAASFPNWYGPLSDQALLRAPSGKTSSQASPGPHLAPHPSAMLLRLDWPAGNWDTVLIPGEQGV